MESSYEIEEECQHSYTILKCLSESLKIAYKPNNFMLQQVNEKSKRKKKTRNNYSNNKKTLRNGYLNSTRHS